MPLIELTLGKENSRTSTAEVFGFLCGEQEELSLYQASKAAGAKVSKLGPGGRFPAQHGRPEGIAGSWNKVTYQVQEGEIIKVWVRKKIGEASRGETAAIYLQARETGPFQKISIPLINEPQRSVLSEAEVTGRFDIIPYNQVTAEGKKSRLDFVTADVMRRFFNVRILAPETARKQVEVKTLVTLESGRMVEVAPVATPQNSRFMAMDFDD